MSNIVDQRVFRTKLILVVFASLFTLTTGYANAQNTSSLDQAPSNAIDSNASSMNQTPSNTIDSNDQESTLSCQSVRCRARQERRIF